MLPKSWPTLLGLGAIFAICATLNRSVVNRLKAGWKDAEERRGTGGDEARAGRDRREPRDGADAERQEPRLLVDVPVDARPSEGIGLDGGDKYSRI